MVHGGHDAVGGVERGGVPDPHLNAPCAFITVTLTASPLTDPTAHRMCEGGPQRGQLPNRPSLQPRRPLAPVARIQQTNKHCSVAPPPKMAAAPAQQPTASAAPINNAGWPVTDTACRHPVTKSDRPKAVGSGRCSIHQIWTVTAGGWCGQRGPRGSSSRNKHWPEGSGQWPVDGIVGCLLFYFLIFFCRKSVKKNKLVWLPNPSSNSAHTSINTNIHQ